MQGTRQRQTDQGCRCGGGRRRCCRRRASAGSFSAGTRTASSLGSASSAAPSSRGQLRRLHQGRAELARARRQPQRELLRVVVMTAHPDPRPSPSPRLRQHPRPLPRPLGHVPRPTRHARRPLPARIKAVAALLPRSAGARPAAAAAAAAAPPTQLAAAAAQQQQQQRAPVLVLRQQRRRPPPRANATATTRRLRCSGQIRSLASRCTGRLGHQDWLLPHGLALRSWLAPRPPLSWPRCSFRRKPASSAVPLAPARAAWQPQRPHPAPLRALGADLLAALTPRRPRAQVGQQARGR